MRILPVHFYIPTIRGLIKNFIKRNTIYPFYASFKLTSRCHFACPFCNMKKHPVKDLETDDIIKILDNLSRSSVLMTSFEGGEPLLREDIQELLKYARRCKFYLLFTTSARNILDYRIDDYCRFIDFLHVSIDEGHDNLSMFKLVLPELTKMHPHVSVQSVVTKESINALSEKVELCYKNKAAIVIIPASPMEGARHSFPDISVLENRINSLRRQFPNTIHTPAGYFKAYKQQKCSSASIIIGPDGYLFYPCHILEEKGPNLISTDLMSWLGSKEAADMRLKMKHCSRNCGWYQYYSINDYLNFRTVYGSLKPIFFK